MFDLQNFPISGGLIMAAAGYVAISFFITGPLIGERTIAKSGWSESCPVALKSKLSAQKPTVPMVPRMDCASTFGWLGQEFEQLCHGFGNPEFKTPEQHMAEAQERALYEMRNRQLEQRAAQSESRCGCAAALVLENQTAWALYAGSARLMVPPKIKDLESELTRILHSPHCALTDGGMS